MNFYKKNDVYQITLITGSADHFLGVTFEDKKDSNHIIKVIE